MMLCLVRTVAGSCRRIWGLEDGIELLTLDLGGTVRAVSFSPDGTRVAVASDNTARIYDIVAPGSRRAAALLADLDTVIARRLAAPTSNERTYHASPPHR